MNTIELTPEERGWLDIEGRLRKRWHDHFYDLLHKEPPPKGMSVFEWHGFIMDRCERQTSKELGYELHRSYYPYGSPRKVAGT